MGEALETSRPDHAPALSEPTTPSAKNGTPAFFIGRRAAYLSRLAGGILEVKNEPRG